MKKYSILELAAIALYQAGCRLTGMKLALIRKLGFARRQIDSPAKGVEAER